MRFMDEAKCQICKRIFCCAKCRQKHQFDTHAIAVKQQPLTDQSVNQAKKQTMDAVIEENTPTPTPTIYVFCPICERKPLTLRPDIYAELLSHIENVHLPLRCRKCQRQYTKIEDLREFSKCVDLGQNCSTAQNQNQNQTCDTDASKITVKRAMSTQTSPRMISKDLNETQYQHLNLNLTPISLFNLRWKAKSRLTSQEEFISDSVSSIRNLSSSSDSVNFSNVQQRRSIGQQLVAPPIDSKGKIIRSTSTPLQVCNVFAKPKEALLTFNATGGGGGGGFGGGAGAGHMSSIYHSGFVLDEHNTPAPVPGPTATSQSQQRGWKVATGRGKMNAVTPLRQVMSKSIQKAFVEHGVGMTRSHHQDGGSSALDLRLSPVVRRTQSHEASSTEQPYQILLSAQKLTTESIIITRSSISGGGLPASTSNASTTSTVYNSCESVEIITSSSSSYTTSSSTTAESLSGAGAGAAASQIPPITPITRIPGAVINKKLIIFETPHKTAAHESVQEEEEQKELEIFYTPNLSSSPATTNPNSPTIENTNNDHRRPKIIPRQLSGQFSPKTKKVSPPPPAGHGHGPRPLGPRPRPPLRACRNQKTFSCVEDIESDEEVFLPNSSSTSNDKKATSEPGRLWSLMSSVMRFPATLRSDRSADKENTNTGSTTGSLIRRCASIAGSLVRTMNPDDDADADDMQSMKRKRTQTLDNQYSSQMSPASSSKRLRIQPRKPIERMRNNY